jgi:putative adenylate-forming enzyme
LNHADAGWDLASRTFETWWTRSAGRQAVKVAAARRVSDLIAFARVASPFYRDAWRGLPDGTALHDLPVVSKRELMARFDDWATDRGIDRRAIDEFLSDRTRIGEFFRGRFLVWKSSGTSGEPGIFVQDRAALAVYDALLALQMQSTPPAVNFAWGLLALGGRAALVSATGDHFASISSWLRACHDSPWANAREFSVMAPLPDLVAQLNEYRPAFLASYPTTLALLASEQREGRLRIAPASVWSGGEHLSSPMRTAIERAFRAPLVNEYGASECMSIAFSCPLGQLHVNADWVVLEPVGRDYRPTPPGEASHTVLLTNLANRVQPIIRYDLGDSVTMADHRCHCGSPLPVIHPEGRRDDVLAFRARDGSLVRLPPLALSTVVEDAAPSHRFQIVQTAPDHIGLRLAARGPGERSAEWLAARKALHEYLASQALPNVRVSLDARAPTPDARSGKMREVIAQI